ncbi:hypothetical protein Zmor_021744 [Zophobas morio]|uniref:Uncharacterized protein n=1 Tax=Zophobas morio TaxID=2755281 RepID=A0AA38MB72_9CUCU|nr:hypothetical protein Zmor_021744 [Zophobas morio]
MLERSDKVTSSACNGMDDTFWNEATDKYYLLIMVDTIMGIAGGCRTAELVADVSYRRSWFCSCCESKKARYLQSYRMYKDLRPKNELHNRFFINQCCGHI